MDSLVTHVGATVAYTAAFLRSCGMIAGPWGDWEEVRASGAPEP